MASGPVFLSRNYDPLQNLFPNDFIDLNEKIDYIPFGENNLIPQDIVQLCRSVTVHRAIINSKSDYFSGTGFSTPDNVLTDWLALVDNESNDFHSIISHLIFDDIMMGNAYFEIVTDEAKSFLKFFHIDASTCRLSVNTDEVILHPNWRKYKGPSDPLRSTIPLFPSFSKGADDQFHSIYHIKVYEPEFSNYGLPKWYAGLSSVIIAGLTDQWNQDRLESQFNSDGMLVIPGVNSPSDMQKLQNKFENLTGAITNPNKNNLVIQFNSDLGPGQSRQDVQYIPFDINDDGSWDELHNRSYSNLLSVHNWFKSLCSFYGEKTGFDTARIINEYEIALNTSIKQFQRRYLAIFNPIFTEWGFDISLLNFENQPPVYRINPVSYVWEVRKDAGLDYNPNDPAQQLFYSQLKNTFSSDASGDKLAKESRSDPNK